MFLVNIESNESVFVFALPCMAVFPPTIALNSANRMAIGSEIEHPISLASEYPEYDCHWYLLSHPSVP